MYNSITKHMKNGSLLSAVYRKSCRMMEREKKLPVSAFRYEFGFGFSNLYHPYVEALKLSNIDLAIDLLTEFYLRFSDLLCAMPVSERLNVQAWKLEDDKVKEGLRNYQGWGQYHMNDLCLKKNDLDKAIRKKAKHLYDIKNSILKNGFKPGSGEFDQGIRGPKLEEHFMLILGGQHRAAVLAALGWSELPATFCNFSANIPAKLNIVNSDKLPLVRRQVMPEAVAVRVLSRIKEGFTTERATNLGFPFA